MKLEKKIALVTGANGGIGGALVRALLVRGAAKVYAAARDIATVEALERQYAGKVVPLQLDITDATSVATVAERCKDLDILINNAGINHCAGLLSPFGMERAREEMEVNFFGTLALCRSFAPHLIARGEGVIANVCSIIGLVNLPINGTYCASKAASHSLLQGLRAELEPRGVRVVGVYPGPVDTRMTAGQEMPKATPNHVAAAIVVGLENGEEDIFPDPMSQDVYARLLQDPKQVERSFRGMIPN